MAASGFSREKTALKLTTKTPVRAIFLGASTLALGLLAVTGTRAQQENISISETFYATGTLDGSAFTDQLITVTGAGSGTVYNSFAANPSHKPDWRIPLQTVTVAGLLDGAPETPFSTTVTDTVFAFVNTKTDTAGISGGGADLVDVQPSDGQFYSYGLKTNVADSGPEPEQEGGYVPFSYDTTAGTLTVASFDSNATFDATVRVTLASLEGGPPDAPTPLPIGGPIGEVTGSIGGSQGSADFYELAWSGGAFEASLSLSGAVPGSSYDFELMDAAGDPIDGLTLNQSNGFSGTLSDLLATGDYDIGLKTNGALDPNFDLQFVTPVQGVAIPEPQTWAMLLLGLGGVGASLRSQKARKAIDGALGTGRPWTEKDGSGQRV
jgi:hypothetical protein